MTFAEHAAKSVSDARVLVELDIGIPNTQWICHGAGIWVVDSNNLYDWVDATLLDGFTAQNFSAIGSMRVDGAIQTKTTSMLALVAATEAFWYDSTTEKLWIHLVDNDEPSIHTIWIGVIYGYSFDEFTPIGREQLYEGRLLGSPSISKRRDPLYFGKLAFAGGTITLANGDGEFDSWVEDNNIYGNEARIYLGYSALDISEYQQLYTGYIETVTVGEETIEIGVVDKRKQLTAPVTYACTAKNALDAIVELITSNYNVTYNATYFDMTAWASAQAASPNVTINMQQPDSVIKVIEGICASVFGVFFVTADNRYSFRLVDTSASGVTTIADADILTRHRIVYNPTEVISSARIGYARDWVTSGNQYTYYTDDTYQTSVYNTYKTYNERTFETYLPTLSAATSFATTIMQYTKDVHGSFPVQLSMAYYARDVGETVDVVVNRATHAMLGTKKSEILEVRYDLAGPTMTLGLRIV